MKHFKLTKNVIVEGTTYRRAVKVVESNVDMYRDAIYPEDVIKGVKAKLQPFLVEVEVKDGNQIIKMGDREKLIPVKKRTITKEMLNSKEEK